MKIDSVQSWRILLTGHLKVATWSFFLISVKLSVIKKEPRINTFWQSSFAVTFYTGPKKYFQ